MIDGCSRTFRAAASSCWRCCSPSCWPRRWLANGYLLTVLIIIFYFAYTGQAWNLMMGFAGQLSLGHALYVGLGGYAAAALYVHFGIGPWLGVPAAIAIAVALRRDHRLARLPLRHRGRLFRAAHHRLRRVHAHRLRSHHVGRRPAACSCRSPIGQQRSVEPARRPDHVLLRDAGADGRGARAVPRPAQEPLGYYWLAIREDEEAARALGINTFRYKMIRGGDLRRR